MRERLLLALFLLSGFGAAQERLVQTGPFGAPIMVADEGGNLSAAVIVYESADLAYVIPDITAAGWRLWHIPEFQKTGKYPVRLYRWYKTSEECASWSHPTAREAEWHTTCANLGFKSSVIVVDVRHQTVHGLWSVFVDRDGNDDIRTIVKLAEKPDMPIASAPKPLQAALARISKIVENESGGGRGD